MEAYLLLYRTSGKCSLIESLTERNFCSVLTKLESLSLHLIC